MHTKKIYLIAIALIFSAPLLATQLNSLQPFSPLKKQNQYQPTTSQQNDHLQLQKICQKKITIKIPFKVDTIHYTLKKSLTPNPKQVEKFWKEIQKPSQVKLYTFISHYQLHLQEIIKMAKKSNPMLNLIKTKQENIFLIYQTSNIAAQLETFFFNNNNNNQEEVWNNLMPLYLTPNHHLQLIQYQNFITSVCYCCSILFDLILKRVTKPVIKITSMMSAIATTVSAIFLAILKDKKARYVSKINIADTLLLLFLNPIISYYITNYSYSPIALITPFWHIFINHKTSSLMSDPTYNNFISLLQEQQQAVSFIKKELDSLKFFQEYCEHKTIVPKTVANLIISFLQPNENSQKNIHTILRKYYTQTAILPITIPSKPLVENTEIAKHKKRALLLLITTTTLSIIYFLFSFYRVTKLLFKP